MSQLLYTKYSHEVCRYIAYNPLAALASVPFSFFLQGLVRRSGWPSHKNSTLYTFTKTPIVRQYIK